MRYLIILVFFVWGSCLSAQDLNKTETDEKTEKLILVGNCNREAFRDTNFAWWFDSEYELYKIDSSLISGFGNTLQLYDITIVMGSWCSDSRREVPRLYKILDSIDYPDDQITLISVDRDKKSPDNIIDELDIDFVPTFIVYRDGEEIGRIIEAPIETLEIDLERIINSD